MGQPYVDGCPLIFQHNSKPLMLGIIKILLLLLNKSSLTYDKIF